VWAWFGCHFARQPRERHLVLPGVSAARMDVSYEREQQVEEERDDAFLQENPAHGEETQQTQSLTDANE